MPETVGSVELSCGVESEAIVRILERITARFVAIFSQ
jgi:hypothetical protein